MTLFRAQDGSWYNLSRLLSAGVGDKENRDSGYPVALSIDCSDGPRPATAAILKTREVAEEYLHQLMGTLADLSRPLIYHSKILAVSEAEEIKL